MNPYCISEYQELTTGAKAAKVPQNSVQAAIEAQQIEHDNAVKKEEERKAANVKASKAKREKIRIENENKDKHDAQEKAKNDKHHTDEINKIKSEEEERIKKEEAAKAAALKKTAEMEKNKLEKDRVDKENSMKKEADRKAKLDKEVEDERKSFVAVLQGMLALKAECASNLVSYKKAMESESKKFNNKWISVHATFKELTGDEKGKQEFKIWWTKYLLERQAKTASRGGGAGSEAANKDLIMLMEDLEADTNKTRLNINDGKEGTQPRIDPPSLQPVAAAPADADQGKVKRAAADINAAERANAPDGSALTGKDPNYKSRVDHTLGAYHQSRSDSGERCFMPYGFQVQTDSECFNYHVLDCEPGDLALHLSYGKMLWENENCRTTGIIAEYLVDDFNPYVV